ncbi:MAG: LD-carboxypeptidase [Pseudomonadota bacterium]
MSRSIEALAIIAPSGPVPPERFRAGIRILEAMGRTVEVFFDPDPGEAQGFLAAPDSVRAARLLEAAASGADAILAARGGYGAVRLLRSLPAGAPGPARTLIGFSDVTALLLGLSRRWGWRGVHGPNVTTLADLDAASLGAFRDLLDAPDRGGRHRGLDRLHPGRGEGPLIGGNLTVLCSLLGTPEEPDLSGRILFLEDTGEAPYRLDRLLHQLSSCRTFPGISGVVIGDLGTGFDDAVRRSLIDLCAACGVPAAAGLAVGHGPRNRPLILGGHAVLDADDGFLDFGQR